MIPPVHLVDYQKRSRLTACYPEEARLYYPALGLAGEAGEVADQVKRVLRDDGATLTPARAEAIAFELGDVLWYLAQLATELGFSLDEVAERNLQKLADRDRRGVLNGSGDNR